MKKGFTLIELLIIIAIIGILATVVIISLSEARARARDGRRLTDLDQIQKALEQYKDANGSYPIIGHGTDDIRWIDSVHNGAIEMKEPWSWIEELSPTFMPIMPIDPINELSPVCNCYKYASVDGKEYKLIACDMESNYGEQKAINSSDGGIVTQWYEVFSPGGKCIQDVYPVPSSC
jgi:prepilin-type N-terminal cleavage/methylation domain-containing protein